MGSRRVTKAMVVVKGVFITDVAVIHQTAGTDLSECGGGGAGCHGRCHGA